jgi:Nif-specific regulatory protein
MMIYSIPGNSPQESRRARIQSELRIVRLLFTISQALNRILDIEEMLQSVLRLMIEHAGVTRGRITLVDRMTGDIEMDLVCGQSPDADSEARRYSGEEITGKVIETGKPVMVQAGSGRPVPPSCSRIAAPDTFRELNPARYICVPLQSSAGDTMGALGAALVFSRDFSPDEELRLLINLAGVLSPAIEIRQEVRDREQALREERNFLQSEILDRFKSMNIVGDSHAVRQVCRLVNQVSSSNANVLISGENGTGKELVAKAIHANSPRADKPFIRVNLAALPESIIESRLFGGKRGRTTGTPSIHKGFWEMAHEGTLFLDEISHLPMTIQGRLLQVMPEKEFGQQGSDAERKPDVRIISATSRDLKELIQNFQFRLDLYYRLNHFPIFVPALRERKTDIPLLANHFVGQAEKKHGKQIRRISIGAINRMMSYHWPGNIRELETCMEKAVLLASNGVIYGHHLPLSLQSFEECSSPGNSLQASLDALEREMILDALSAARGDSARAAQSLDISERQMRLRIAKYRIDAKRFKRRARSASPYG